MKQRIIIGAIVACWVVTFLALGIGPARADSNYVSLGLNLFDDFDSGLTYAQDYCIGMWDRGAVGSPLFDIGGYTVNNIAGYSCPISAPNAALDIFTSPTTNLPMNVYYNSITVFTPETWGGNVLVMESDLHANAAYYVIASQSIQNDTSLHTNSYNQFGTTIPINRVINAPWGIRFAANVSCPQFDPLTFTLGDICPAITEVSVSYRATTTDTPPPTHTIPPTWTPNGTTTDYPTFTPGPADTLAASPTMGSTISLARHSIPGLITPTDYPCNLDPYTFQGSNNLGTPCGTLVSFATIALPTLNLPSPTLVALLPTNTAQVITATPSATLTATLTPTQTNTLAAGQPIPGATFGIDTSAISLMSTSVSDSFATVVPLANLQVPVNGTMVGMASVAQGAGNSIGSVIILGRSLVATGFDAGGLIAFALIVLVFIVVVQIFIVVMPLVMYIIRIFIQVAGIIIDIV